MAQKKRGGTVKVVAGGAVILALLSGLGLGLGGKLGFLNNAAVPAISQTDTEDSQSEKAEDPVESVVDETEVAERKTEIRVRENEILFHGEAVSLDVLKEKLLSEYDGKTPWKLVNNHAIKADYDSVKALLDELNMTYVEK